MKTFGKNDIYAPVAGFALGKVEFGKINKILSFQDLSRVLNPT